MKSVVKDEIELSVYELEQINVRLQILKRKSDELKYINTEIELFKSELSKHINRLVVSKGGDPDLNWNFDGKKIIKT